MGHVQTTIRKLITWAQSAQVHDLAFHPHYKPDWNVLLSLVVDSLLIKYSSFYWRLIDSCQTRASANHHHLYRGLLFTHWRHVFFKFSADILFDQGLNSLFWAKPHSLENVSIRQNLAITWPYTDRPTFRPSASQAYQCLISHFLASLGTCNLKLYIHVLINWQLSKSVSADQYRLTVSRALLSSVF